LEDAAEYMSSDGEQAKKPVAKKRPRVQIGYDDEKEMEYEYEVENSKSKRQKTSKNV
jgi:hypothetical protein